MKLTHLARGDADLRLSQATGLREWAKEQSLPIIAAGDFNFDWDFPTEKGNAAFDAFVEGDVWKWVKPAELIDSNWADRDNDGQDDYPHSILDFVFVANAARTWQSFSRVVTEAGDFPDDRTTSDHRPVECVFSLD